MSEQDYNRFAFDQPVADEEPQAQMEPPAVEVAPISETIVTAVPPVEEPSVKTAKKKGRGIKVVAACLACAIVGGLVGGAGAILAVQQNQTTQGETVTIYEGVTSTSAVEVAYVDGLTQMTPEEIYATNLTACVGISGNVTTNIWGQTVQNATSGSGFVVTADGYILTNYHVIDGVDDIVVSFADGTSYDAVFVGGEEDNDIAVLKIEATGLQTVVIGDSDALAVGQMVTAVGNPLGELTFSLSVGYVSALDRAIAVDDSTVINMFQTDAAVNAGNSGGPMFDQYGQVVGIVSAKYSSDSSSSSASVEGLGFVIPINDVMGMVTSIIEYGYVTGKPSVGIYMNDVDATISQRFDIPGGAYVESILEGSCADVAGLQVGDVITAINDTVVSSSSQLQTAVSQYDAGDTVSFTVYRSGETFIMAVTLDESNDQRTADMDALYEAYLETYYSSSSSSSNAGTTTPDDSQSSGSYQFPGR